MVNFYFLAGSLYLNGVKQQLGHARSLDVDEMRLEESLGRLEALASHLDHAPVWQLKTSQ